MPAWPEAVLEIEVRDPRGDPVRDVRLGPVAVGGRFRHDLAVERVDASRFRVRGIPARPDERVRGAMDGRNAPGPRASLAVHAQGSDGSPVAGAGVTIDGETVGTTDEHGSLNVEGLPPTTCTVELRPSGRFPMERTLTLAPGEAHTLTLREARGARLHVQVTDPEGAPRPFARLDIPYRRVFDIRDDEQRLDAYTDVEGRRTLERVEPGRATIRAHWGSRRGKMEIDLVDGETTHISIVVR